MQHHEKEEWAAIAQRARAKGDLASKNIGVRTYSRYVCYMKDKGISPSKVAHEAFRKVLEAVGVDINAPHPDEENIPLRGARGKVVIE